MSTFLLFFDFAKNIIPYLSELLDAFGKAGIKSVVP